MAPKIITSKIWSKRKWHLFLELLLFYVYECLFAWIYVYFVCAEATQAERGCQNPWTWNCS